MALAFVSSTVSANAPGSGTIVPCAYPASIAAGDVLVVLLGAKPFNTLITPFGGWQFLGSATNGSTAQGADTGSVLIAAFGKEANGTETGNLTATFSGGNSGWLSIYRFTKSAGTVVNFAAATGTDTTVNTSWSVAYGTNPGITSGDHLVLGGVWPTDLALSVSASALAATSATFTGIVAAGDNNPRVTQGNQIGGNTNHCSCSAGTASANPTWTATHSIASNNSGTGIIVRLRETAPGTPTAGLTAGVW